MSVSFVSFGPVDRRDKETPPHQSTSRQTTFWRAGFDIESDTSPPGARLRSSSGLTIAYQRYIADTGLTQEIRIDFTIWVL